MVKKDNKNLIKIVNKFGKEIKNEFGEIENIILFGSVAEGKETEESDIDLLVVTKKDEANTKRYIETYTHNFFFKNVGMLAVPVIISKKRFQDMVKHKYPFILNVMKGVSIVR